MDLAEEIDGTGTRFDPSAPLTLTTLGKLAVRRVQNRSKYLNLLVYGDSGVGKTTLAGSADEVPELRPVIVIDNEGGTESLVRSYPEVEHVRVTTWREMQAVYDELHRGNHGYQTVVLDSLTEIQKFNMFQIMADLVAEKPEMDPDVPGIREWGRNLEQMRRFVRGFRDLPMNTIFTALSKKDKDMQSGKVEIMPSLSGKMATEISGLLDIVCYMYVKQVKVDGSDQMIRCLLTKKTEKQVAKDRTNTLKTVETDPTMRLLFDRIHATKPLQDGGVALHPDAVTVPQPISED
jgi:hypothetical protein